MKKIEWYAPGKIIFNRKQIKWLLPHLYLIREGYWPLEHKYSGYLYVGGLTTGARNNNAPFITPCEIAAELEVRMERCGIAGWMMEFVYCNASEDKLSLFYKISKYTGDNIDDITFKSYHAIGYCRGRKRNEGTFDKYIENQGTIDKRRQEKGAAFCCPLRKGVVNEHSIYARVSLGKL